MKTTSAAKTLAILLSLMLLFGSLGPAVASAQNITSGANTTANTGGTTGSNSTNTPSTCSISFSNGVDWNFTDCIWIPMMSWFGGFFLSIGAYVLSWSGWLFDMLVQSVIIQFGSTLSSLGVIVAINTGWSIFRDLANIVIIGMFTFIAIATILGNTEYGYKKMLARVLIVAVLLNFSLLFSKIIIDVGNFTAYQLYQAMAQSQQLQGLTQTGTGGTQFDIVGAFERPMGVSGLFNNQQMLKQFGLTVNSGLQAFAIGLAGGLLLIGLAIVLLYGCFLIITRALVMVILMVTASIAFASYLHPRLSESEFGWRGWWKALLNVSLFGPLLMLFLAISFLIVNGASKAMASATGTQTGNLGATVFNAMTSPGTAVTNSTGWSVMLLYLFGVGFLFISLRLSSSFASNVAGLSLGQQAWGSFFSSATNGLSGAGRFFGRNTAGRGAYTYEQSQTALAQQKRAEAAQARINGNLADAARLERAANTHSRNASVAGTLSSGYKKVVQKRASEVAAAVQRTQPTKEMRDSQVAAAEETKTAATKGAEELAKTLKKTREDAAKSADTVRTELEKEIKSNPELKATHEKNTGEVEKASAEAVKKISDKYADQVKQITDQINRGGITDARKNDLEKQLLESKGSRDSELRHENERVEKARRVALLNTANSEAAQKVLERNETLRNATQELQALNLTEDNLGDVKAKRAAAESLPGRKEVVEAHNQTTNEMVGRVASNQIGYFGNRTANSDDVTKAARSKLKTDSENGNIRRLVNGLKADLSEGEEKKEK